MSGARAKKNWSWLSLENSKYSWSSEKLKRHEKIIGHFHWRKMILLRCACLLPFFGNWTLSIPQWCSSHNNMSPFIQKHNQLQWLFCSGIKSMVRRLIKAINIAYHIQLQIQLTVHTVFIIWPINSHFTEIGSGNWLEVVLNLTGLFVLFENLLWKMKNKRFRNDIAKHYSLFSFWTAFWEYFWDFSKDSSSSKLFQSENMVFYMFKMLHKITTRESHLKWS